MTSSINLLATDGNINKYTIFVLPVILKLERTQNIKWCIRHLQADKYTNTNTNGLRFLLPYSFAN